MISFSYDFSSTLSQKGCEIGPFFLFRQWKMPTAGWLKQLLANLAR
jgi:hypothetical protein